MKDEIEGMKHQLNPALQDLTWAQDDLWNYIQGTQDLVKVLNMSCISKGNLSIAQTNKRCKTTLGSFTSTQVHTILQNI